MLLTSSTTTSSSEPISVFISYSHADEEYRDLLDLHLGMLKREGLIETWHDRGIYAGQELDTEISQHLSNAHIVLLLISPDFVSSDYCFHRELKEALKRSEMGHAKTIPIILRPTEGWQNAPFGRLMALPTDGKAVASWDSVDEALENVAKGIRSAILNFDLALNTETDQHSSGSQWFLEVEPTEDDLEPERLQAIVSEVRHLSGDESVSLLGFEARNGNLVLEGPQTAFDEIQQLFNDGRLSDALGICIKSLAYSAGASVQTRVTFALGGAEPAEMTCAGEDLRILPSEKFAPAVLKTVLIDPADLSERDFVLDAGDSDLDEANVEEESRKLINYFHAGLTVPEEDLWVNLTDYERHRIIPRILKQTELGRDLLEIDILLKRYTASLLRPGNERADNFWKVVFRKAREVYGSTPAEINMFQKIWLTPEKAAVDEVVDDKRWRIRATVTESSLDVLCEADHFALKAHLKSRKLKTGGRAKARRMQDFCVETFKRTMLAEIKKEVNEGKNFAAIRQMYNSMILAEYVKHKAKDYPQLRTSLYMGQGLTNGLEPATGAKASDLYEEYLTSVKRGVFNHVAKQFDSDTRQLTTRTYFSGAILIGSTRLERAK